MKVIHIHKCPVCGSENLEPVFSCSDNLASQEQFTISRCKKCEFAFTQDFPVEAEIGKYYEGEDYISHSDNQNGIVNKLYHWARKISLKSKCNLVFKYSKKKTGLLLDIGSGTGYFLNQMRQAKWVVTGIEKSEGVRTYTKERFGLDSQDSDYINQIPLKTKDVVTMWHVLEHIEELNATMQTLHKILKDDGLLVIALPNKKSYDALSYKQHWAAYDVPRHLWHFSPSDFKLLAKKHNFKLKKMKPMYFDAFYIAMLSEKAKGTKCASLVGLIKGGFFFLGSLFNTKKCSSIIYILKKR